MTNFRNFTVIDHCQFDAHDIGSGTHPESPDRLGVIRSRLKGSILKDFITQVEASTVDRDIFLAVHDDAYLYRFEEAALSGNLDIDHSDNQICYESFDVAMLSASAGVNAIDLIESNRAKTVYCNIRPPGHHAERKAALGFCFLNNSLVAARYWQKKYQKRVFVIDWDAHHGNGIQSGVESDPDIFYVSIHEHPTFSFPGTGYAEEVGVGEGKGTILNIPLPPGATDEMVIRALNEKVAPALKKFKPEAIVVAAGFDGHQLDDMSALCYSTNLYAQLGVYMNVWAQQYCGGRIVSILEGGYHLQALAASVEAYLAGLSAIDTNK
nr:histone deacetylase [Desulfobulbaceae bacterium]